MRAKRGSDGRRSVGSGGVEDRRRRAQRAGLNLDRIEPAQRHVMSNASIQFGKEIVTLVHHANVLSGLLVPSVEDPRLFRY